MITIKRIDFLNFRIAGTCSLSFDDPGNGYHMFGIVAENGTGKTTILNAITWCLYEHEYQLKDEDSALPIINSKKLSEMELDSTENVGVKLTIQDEDKELVFERNLKILRTQNDFGVPIAKSDTRSTFVVTISELTSSAGTKSYYDEDGEFYVADYFENKIHDFFFFDGERLEDFFSLDKANSIKTSVEAISQISLLDATIENSNTIANTKRREISKNQPALQRLEKDKQEAEQAWKKELNNLTTYENQKADAKEKKRAIDDILSKNAASASLQREKKIREEQIQDIKRQQEKMYKQNVQFAIRSTILIKFYPMIISSLNLIEEKGNSGDFPVYLTRKQLETILKEATEHSSSSCPICGSRINTIQMLHLQEIIGRQTVDDDTATTLTRLKEDLCSARDKILSFREQYQDYEAQRIELEDKLQRATEEHKNVSEKLSRLGSLLDENGDIIDFSDLQRKSRQLESQIASLDQSIGASTTLASINERKFKEASAKYEDAVQRENKDKSSQDVIDTLCFVANQLTNVKKSITQEVRTALEKLTFDIFMSVIKKKQTFGKIVINDNYKLDLYDEYGQLMTGSACATEYMALAYAYTLAIHEASSHNCPLVIDYPLGRISGEIRENTASMMLDTSRNKQIIMLLTEDEYSEKVQKLFEGKAVIKTISLADNEKSWKEVSI